MKEKKLIQPFLKHDDNASQDGKILKMYLDFRKLAKTMDREELETFVAHGAYAIFWRILEFMRNNQLPENDIEVISDNLRIKTEYVSKILNDFNLFHVENGEYISERLLRDLRNQEEKSKAASDSAKTKWLLSAFNKYYKEFFEQEAILDSDEIEKLKKYQDAIPDLKEKLRDILYTLKNLRFETDINYKPSANWLLKGNNLGKLLNGEFGKLKHKKTAVEIREEEKELCKKRKEAQQPDEFREECESINEKEKAIELAIQSINTFDFIAPPIKALMERFNITIEELKEYKNAV